VSPAVGGANPADHDTSEHLRPSRLRPLAWGFGILAVAAGLGALIPVLPAVILGTLLVLVGVVLQFRRASRPPGGRPIPPTWSVTLAAPVLLGASLVDAVGPLAGGAAIVTLVVIFLVVAGDMFF
jgi:hypothetical protein